MHLIKLATASFTLTGRRYNHNISFHTQSSNERYFGKTHKILCPYFTLMDLTASRPKESRNPSQPILPPNLANTSQRVTHTEAKFAACDV